MELNLFKPIFKNVTKYNAKNYNNFIQFHNDKFGNSYFFITLLFTILIIYIFVMNILNKNFVLCLILLCGLFLFLYFRLFVPVKEYKDNSKMLKNNKQLTYTFTFYKNFFTINKKRYYYFSLHKVFETKDYFYLYINENNAALLSKDGFKLGNCNDFTNFIKKKCLLKYKESK